MRKEITKLLKTDWRKLPDGIGGLVLSIMKLRPTENEMKAFAARLGSCHEDDEDEAVVIMALMRDMPRAYFRPALVEALEASRIMSCVAARTLLHAGYEEASEAILASPHAIRSLGDDLPLEMMTRAENLPPDKQKILLKQFFRFISERPDEVSRNWLRMVSMLSIQDKRLTPVLWQTWQGMPMAGDWLEERLALLDAMVAHADPIFKPAFEKSARSRNPDVKAIGRAGLFVLTELAAGRSPYDHPAVKDVEGDFVYPWLE